MNTAKQMNTFGSWNLPPGVMPVDVDGSNLAVEDALNRIAKMTGEDLERNLFDNRIEFDADIDDPRELLEKAVFDGDVEPEDVR